MDAGEEHRGVQAVVGDVVAVGVGDLGDEAIDIGIELGIGR